MYPGKGNCTLTHYISFWWLGPNRLFVQNLETEDYTCSKYSIK